MIMAEALAPVNDRLDAIEWLLADDGPTGPSRFGVKIIAPPGERRDALVSAVMRALDELEIPYSTAGNTQAMPRDGKLLKAYCEATGQPVAIGFEDR